MSNYLFTSESVTSGHPDKIADQISDAIVDACLAEDRFSRVACETLVSPGIVFLAGEITSNAHLDWQEVTRDTIRDIGYSRCALGFDYRSVGVIASFHKQSQDIARGITNDPAHFEKMGAGDQGIMFGFACDETPELMPLPISLAHKLTAAVEEYRKNSKLKYLRPDGKSQVTVEYAKDGKPLRIHTIVLSAQTDDHITTEQIRHDLKELIDHTLEKEPIDSKTIYHINPSGRFVIGGPAADTGMTGRKTIVDTYGGRGHHGGGAFSGKDPTKIDRAGAYAARYVAKNIVAAKLAKICEVQISYAIGLKAPLSIKVDTFHTSVVDERELEKVILEIFDLTPGGIIQTLSLDRPIFKKTAAGGHFGRELPEFTWEKVDKEDVLKAYFLNK